MAELHNATSPKDGSLPTTARGRRTRNAILHAAREIFEEDGFADARIADIMKRANVSYGSFYNYFESKHEVFREIVNSATGEMFLATRAESPQTADPVERIRYSTERYLEAYGRNTHIMRVIEQVTPYDDHFNTVSLEIRQLFVDRIAHSITRLQNEGLADPHLEPKLAASMLGGMVEHFAKVWFLMGETHDKNTAINTLTRLWAQAIGLTVTASGTKLAHKVDALT
ncbi:MAG: TetR/AcrR family transcriptional regulator [Leucobacter sp.]|nr:TetR/AcrR family transcriptional regulator [Leucobacter sp.]